MTICDKCNSANGVCSYTLTRRVVAGAMETNYPKSLDLCNSCYNQVVSPSKSQEVEGVEPQPAARTPRLVEAVDMVDACDQIISDTDLALRSMSVVDIFTILHGIDARANRMRLALAAEKKRQELVEAVIDVTREQVYINRRRGVQSKFTEVIDALDAYEKGEAQ